MSLPFQPYPFKLTPFLVDRPWGGNRLADRLNKGPQARGKGESWEVSDFPEAPSVVAAGPARGMHLGDLLRRYCEPLCGVSQLPPQFPLLVKFIDADAHLSIQVHPDDEAVRPQGCRGKTECWYILDCPPDGEVLCGLREGVTPDDLLVRAGTPGLVDCLCRIPIRPGTFIRIPAGTVHAILAGTLVCEISQASTVIERLWDWGRPHLPERRIDVEAAIPHITFNESEAALRARVMSTEGSAGETELVTNRHFDVRMIALPRGRHSVRLSNPHGLILSVVDGSADCAWPGRASAAPEERLALGETWFLPAGFEDLELEAGAGGLKALISRSMEIGAPAEPSLPSK